MRARTSIPEGICSCSSEMTASWRLSVVSVHLSFSCVSHFSKKSKQTRNLAIFGKSESTSAGYKNTKVVTAKASSVLQVLVQCKNVTQEAEHLHSVVGWFQQKRRWVVFVINLQGVAELEFSGWKNWIRHLKRKKLYFRLQWAVLDEKQTFLSYPSLWCDTPAVNLNHRGTGGSTVHSINTEIRATVASLTWDTQLIVYDITTLVPTPTDSFSCLCTKPHAKLLSSKLSTKDQNSDLAFTQWVHSPKSEHGNSLSSQQQQRITPNLHTCTRPSTSNQWAYSISLPTTMATLRRIDHSYARCGSPTRSRHEDEHGLNEGEPQLDMEEVIVTAPPQSSRFHMFTNLARAIRMRISYMWGSFRRIITPVHDRSSPLEQAIPPTPQDTIRGQLNKGWVPLSEHLPRDYDEVFTHDRLHCLETTIAHTLMTHSTLLPNCLPLLQEVENDICNCVQLTSAQSDAMAWYTVLGTYAILASHINNLASCSARRGLFPDTTTTSSPQPLPPIPPNNPSSTPTPPFPPPFPSPPLPHHFYPPFLLLHHHHPHLLPCPYTFPHLRHHLPSHPHHHRLHPFPHHHQSQPHHPMPHPSIIVNLNSPTPNLTTNTSQRNPTASATQPLPPTTLRTLAHANPPTSYHLPFPRWPPPHTTSWTGNVPRCPGVRVCLSSRVF